MFWEMHDALFADPARLEDPHLWDRARALGLDLERFDADRRSDAARDRVTRDFRSGVRGGVVTTPTLFAVGAGGALVAVDRDAVGQLTASA
jgi:predicted DsbA family dithiol-disulfide isomerase